MRRRGAFLGIAAAAFLAACGSSGQTFGGAAEDWCHDHYPKPEAAEERCFEVVTDRGPKFLERLETGEAIQAEIDALRGN